MPPRMPHRLLLVASAISMLSGGLLYVLYRPPSLLMFRWFDALGLDPSVERLRAIAAQQPQPPAWAIGSLPHALWLLSGLLLLAWIWRGSDGITPLLWIGLLVAFAAGGEIGQWLGVVPGTFDPLDLALMSAACLAALPFVAACRRPRKDWRTS